MIQKYPLKKIVVSVGVGRMSQQADFEKNIYPEIQKALAQITGQKPQDRPARKSIAGFKLREGTIVGMRITLRRERMMHFIDKVTNIVIPRIRDFHGIKTRNIDEHGNLNFGIKEHTVFPEIILEDVHHNFGIEITLVPQDKMTIGEATDFYRKLGVPLEREKVESK